MLLHLSFLVPAALFLPLFSSPCSPFPPPPRYFTSSYILFPSQLLPMSLPIPVPGFWFYTSLFKLFSFCLTFSTFPLSVPAPSLPFSTPCNQLPPLSFPVVCTFSLSVTTHWHFSPILPCQFFPFSLPIHAPSLPVPHLFSTLPLSVPSFPLTPP